MKSATPEPIQMTPDECRTGLSTEFLKRSFVDSLLFDQARFPGRATPLDFYLAVATGIRDRIINRWIATMQTFVEQDVRIVCYLSAEFLLGPHLGNNLINLGITSEADQAMRDLGLDPQTIIDQEPEPGLGNGGLGRLAACYMDSMSTLDIPAIGFGIRYEYGIFDQIIRDGWQVEVTDKWLQWGNPWEIARPEGAVTIGFGGHTESFFDEHGKYRVRWIPGRLVKAIPYDTPIAGYRTDNVNTLRLWKAEAVESFNFNAFNVGDYVGSVREKMQSENISKILYPNDDNLSGKELRLEQQYFFVSASLQTMVGIHLRQGRALDRFHEKWALQMNDTHPSISVAELMRLLMDEHGLSWEAAWNTTNKTLGFTNHTLLPEALEKWPLPLFQSLLPRHLEIIFEINRRFLDDVKIKFPHDDGRLRRLSLIDETGERFVRMANLAAVGSHAVNGVAALHSELIKKDLFHDLYEMYPERFSNKTNGVTPRRWIVLANPGLSSLITSRIGDSWISNLDHLRKLEDCVADPAFRNEWQLCQHAVKQRLVDYIQAKTGVSVDPASMFDTMVKRIHEYKRQHLKVLHIVTLYNRIKNNPSEHRIPRTFLFGGKAAPGYFMAKLIIKLINSVAEVVNADEDVAGRLKVVFLPDYNVTFGQRVYPAADLSEQISLAGKEASGTGNMKFAMNGALTVGTLDGANIEIREAVGAENFFLFGLTTDQVYQMKSEGYNPKKFYDENSELRETMDVLGSGRFSKGDTSLFRPILDTLLYRDDPYMLMADYQSYIECQDKISQAFLDQDHWTRMSILNTARMGKFSSDRAIGEYAADIWHTKPVKVNRPSGT